MPAVPDLWHYEMGSVLIASRQGERISAAKPGAAQIALRALGVETLAIELDACGTKGLQGRTFDLDVSCANGNPATITATMAADHVDTR